MRLIPLAAALAAALPLVGSWSPAATAAEPSSGLKTKNVILMMTDGLRWEEVFRGAEPELISKAPGGVRDVEGIKNRLGQETAQERRAALLPFITEVVAKQGQLYGDEGEESRVTNGKNFSYPGYSETFVGYGVPRIDSNDHVNNPNVTVLEWLHGKDGYQGKVAGFGAWDCFPYILNRERSGMKVRACWEPPVGDDLTPQEILLGDLIENTHRLWSSCGYDSFTFNMALENLKREKTRVTFIGLGETDEFAHGGQYDNYLTSANKFDHYVKTVWETVQSMPEYKDQTTLILTTDHGRGGLPNGWRHHGADVKGAERIWIGILGPDTPPRGDAPLPQANQNQIAATLAAFLGEDYNAFQPKAGPVIQRALPQAEGR